MADSRGGVDARLAHGTLAHLRALSAQSGALLAAQAGRDARAEEAAEAARALAEARGRVAALARRLKAAEAGCVCLGTFRWGLHMCCWALACFDCLLA
jgi:hypothetical protein